MILGFRRFEELNPEEESRNDTLFLKSYFLPLMGKIVKRRNWLLFKKKKLNLDIRL